MGAIADALVNAGLKQAQALIIEKGLGANGARPSVAEFQEALVRAGVDHHSASILASTILSSVPGDGNGRLYRLLSAATERAARNNPFDLPVMSSPPTVSATQTNPSPRREIGYWGTSGFAQFALIGCTAPLLPAWAQFSTHNVGIQGCRTAATTWQPNVCGGWVEFVTDAPTFGAEFSGTLAYPLLMAIGTPDMRDMRVTATAGHTLAATPGGFTVDWAGARAMRGYRVYLNMDQRLGRLSIGADDTLERPRVYRPRVLDIGDSITANTVSPIGTANRGMSDVARDISGCDLVGHGVGGSGWVAGNKLGNTWRLEDAATAAAAGLDLVRVHLGINDGSFSASVAAECALVLPQLRQAVGSVPIQVFGPLGGARGPDAGVLAVEAALQQAVVDFNDPLTIFTPTVTASATTYPETTGTKDADTTTGTAGNSRWVTGNDNVHPTAAFFANGPYAMTGAEFYARRRWAQTLEAVRAAGW